MIRVLSSHYVAGQRLSLDETLTQEASLDTEMCSHLS